MGILCTTPRKCGSRTFCTEHKTNISISDFSNTNMFKATLIENKTYEIALRLA